VLTKRHENLLRYSRRRRLPSNFWAGVTVENEEYARIRVPTLLQVQAEIRFLSMEPILSHIDVNPYLAGRDNRVGGDGLQWLIFGGESGSHLSKTEVMEKRGLVELRTRRSSDPSGMSNWQPREDRLAWARDVRDACQAHGSLYFFKQWGGPRSTSGGKLLDGRTWEEFPRLPTAPPAPASGQLTLGG
jgi:protein gp37